MDMRELKGLELAARSKIIWDGKAWSVPSQTGDGKYRVCTWPGAESCTCEDFALRQSPCKHVIAARLVEERDGKRPAPAMDMESIPKRPTYKQDWPAYNAAQTQEKHRLQVLLADLCRGLDELPYYGKGRRRVPIADALFAAVFKVYSTVSARRFMSDLRDAHERGYLSRPLHYNSIFHYLESPDYTPALRRMIGQSALPLRAVETEFAPDSTGFTTSRFVRWFDHKYNAMREGHDWIKAHVMTGVRTNVVTAVEIHGRDAADSPQFRPLLEATAANFAVKEVSADKAYLSRDNLDLVAGLGGTAFVPFKSNSVPGEAGTLWERMFFYYQFRRQEFLQHYHKRSNVEATFSMVKRKFGDSVRSRTDVAMVNEVLCKLLCHNLCVLIQSQYELGIEATFWDDTADGPRDVLPLVHRG